jgi:hypothetical protein
MKRFKKQLVDQGVNTIVRRNDQGRIYERFYWPWIAHCGMDPIKQIYLPIFNDFGKMKGQKVHERQHIQNNFIHS